MTALVAIVAMALPAEAQSVISAHAGVIHYFEGAVFLADQPLQSHLGRYPGVPEGAELRTAEGRAEVLLTPGVFLRMNNQTAIRMVTNDLADTRVELLAGSIIVESGEPNAGTLVTLIFRGRDVQLLRHGMYRIDSAPPRIWVRQGEVEVSSGNDARPVAARAGMSLSLADVADTDESVAEPDDSFRDWTVGRSESVSADDAIAAQIDEDPPTLAILADNPIYFPVLGVPSPSLDSTGVYGSVGVYQPAYQPGFSSIYLPGYTYRPVIISLIGRGLQNYPLRPVGIIGISPGVGIFAPVGSLPSVPRLPVMSPLTPRIPVLTPAPHPPVMRAPVGIGVKR